MHGGVVQGVSSVSAYDHNSTLTATPIRLAQVPEDPVVNGANRVMPFILPEPCAGEFGGKDNLLNHESSLKNGPLVDVRSESGSTRTNLSADLNI